MTCPICETVNKGLFLEETNGWMECEHCHQTVKVLQVEGYRDRKVPVLTPKQAAVLYGKAT